MRCQTLVAYAKSCAQPGLEYFQRQLDNSLAASLAAFRGARFFSPQKVYLLQPDAAMVVQSFASIPFFNSKVIDHLKEELPQYLARAADTSATLSPLDWWKRNSSDIPHFAQAAKKILLLQPSSAAAERVFPFTKFIW